MYSRRQRTTLLAVLFLVGTCSYVDKNIIGVLLEQIKAEFQVSDTMLGVLSGISFALFYATIGIPVARWADCGNRKTVISVSLTAWSAMTALCGMAGTYWQLALARFGVGAGEAGAIPPAQSLIADYFPPSERTRAISIFLTSSSAGYAIGLMLGGWIAHNYGWRAAFITVGLAGIALTPIAQAVLKEPRLLPKFAVRTVSRETAAGAIRALFAKVTYRNLLCGIVVYFLWTYGVMVFVVPLMIRVQGLNVAQAGSVFGATAAVGAVIGSLVGGVLADMLATRDIRWLAWLASLGMLATIPLYGVALWSSEIVSMVVALLLGMIVLSAAVPPAYSAILSVCGAPRRASAIAVAFFFANLVGLGLGPIVAGVLSDRFAATHGPGEGLRLALTCVTAVLFPAAWFMFRAARTIQEEQDD